MYRKNIKGVNKQVIQVTDMKVEKALLVGVKLPETSVYEVEEHLDELERLCQTAGAEVIGRIIQERRLIDPTFFIGKGKVHEIASFVEKNNIQLVIFDDDLSPAQSRNLEKIIKAKVIDRSALILDIFAAHARTREAKTQVELAQLQYMLPRLTRQWTHLSRQVGGIGTKGPGETQLETDRRLVRTRIAKLKKELEKIEMQRRVQKRGREQYFRISLIGYTNAGKSTIMNLLTHAKVKIEDQLFATLDSTVRKLSLSDEIEILLSDTVGFIRKLPHHLVASFRSTLEEVREADLLLHVIDVSDSAYEEHIQVVHQVLKDMKINDKMILPVFNKIDLLEEDNLLIHLKQKFKNAVFVSAAKNIGIRKLLGTIKKILDEQYVINEWHLPIEELKNRHIFLRYGSILKEKLVEQKYYQLITKINREKFDKLLKENEAFSAWRIK